MSASEFSLGDLTVAVVEGDITSQPVDAIVNAANNALWMGSGVAGAIKARGGVEIERDAMAQGPIPIGDAVVTGAGRLPMTCVVHAAVMGQDLRTDERLVRRATASALEAARARGVRSIALPALGTGVGGFPLERCAEVMIHAVREHAAAPLARVVFVLWGQAAFDAFDRVARRELGASRP